MTTLEEAEALAPEHLVLLGDAEREVGRVSNAGAVFVGPWSPVAAGDYATGGNHVLPTDGWARSVGGLGLETFLKPVTVQRLTRGGARARPPDGRGARRGRRDAGARGGGAAMRALAPEFRPYEWAAADATRSRGSPASTRRRCVRFDQNTPPLPLPSTRPATVAGALARVNGYPAAATARASRRRSPTYAGVEPENVVLGVGADDLILLCARAYAGPGDASRSRDAPTYPLYRIAAQLAGAERRRRRSGAHVRVPPEQPDRRARPAARTRGRSSSTRRTSSTRRDGGRR